MYASFDMYFEMDYLDARCIWNAGEILTTEVFLNARGLGMEILPSLGPIVTSVTVGQ